MLVRTAPTRLGFAYQPPSRHHLAVLRLLLYHIPWRLRKGGVFSWNIPTGAASDLCKDTANCPHLRIAHILAYMCLRLRRGATLPPAKRSVHYRSHLTGGPSLRDGHSQLSHRIKKSGVCEKSEWEMTF